MLTGWVILQNIHEACINYLVISSVIIIGLFFTLIVILLYMSYKKEYYRSEIEHYKKDLVQAVKNTREFVQSNIAKNLHDDISMPLNVVALNLAKISKNLDDKALTERLLEKSLALLQKSIEEIRLTAKELCPPSVIKLGYVKSIIELCNHINACERVKANLIINSDKIRLAPPVELEAYRITQEILNNIIKYGRTREMNISVSADEKGINTTVSYLGLGIDPKRLEELTESGNGVGLKNILDRAKSINANINYLLIDACECRTTIEIPIYEKTDLSSNS